VSDEIIKTVLHHCSKTKHDVMEVLKVIIEDLTSIDDEIYSGGLIAASKGRDWYNVSSFDPFLSNVISSCLDYVLKMKRDFVKGLTAFQVTEICTIIMKILNQQNSRVNEIYKALRDPASQLLSPEHLMATRSMDDENFREVCLRFISQICQENPSMVDDKIVESIFVYVSGIAFLPESVYFDQKNKKQIAVGKNVNSFFYKTLRGAFNCIANLLA